MKMMILMLLMMGVLGMDDSEDWDKLMEEPVDRAEWVDPWDMGLGRVESCGELEERVHICDKQLVTCQRGLEKLSQQINSSGGEMKKQSPAGDVKTASEVFLKRHVNYLISKLQLDPDKDSHVKVELMLTTRQIQTLFNFVSSQPSSHAVDVDTVLSSYIRTVDKFEQSHMIDNVREKLSAAKDPLLVILMSISLVYILIIVFRYAESI